MYIKETIQKHSKYKDTYYQNIHTIVKTPAHTHTHTHITKPTHTHTHVLQNKLKQPKYKNTHQIKQPQYTQVPSKPMVKSE